MTNNLVDIPMAHCKQKNHSQHNNNAQGDKQPKKPHRLRNLVGMTLLGKATVTTATVAGVWGTWQYMKAQAHNRRRHSASFDQVVTANRYCGRVHKNADEFILTTAGATYHVVDPLAIIDKLAQQQAEQADKLKKSPAKLAAPRRDDDTKLPTAYYDIDVCVLAELSQKGRYGYLGHLDYQLTIVDVADL